jgi:hypothetical protein
MAMPPVYEGLRAERIRERAAALARFAAWEEQSPARLGPEAALSGVSFLYDLLPPAARARPVDASGVVAMQRALAVLGRGR